MRFIYILFFFMLASLQSAFAIDVKEINLPNGNKILALPAKTLPMAVIQISFTDMGAVSDPANKAGLAFLGAEMLVEGAGKLNGGDFQRALEDKAIELSVSAGRENLTITMQALSKYIPEAMHLLTMLITKPSFSPDALEKIRSQTLTLIKQNSQSPSWLANTHFNAEAYGGHSYGLPVEGTEKSVKTIKRADLQKWQQSFAADNIIISSAGDISEDTLSKNISELISVLPEHSEIRNLPAAPVIKSEAEPIIIKYDIPQTIALFGLPAIKRTNPNFYAAYVMNNILGGGGLTSRLSRSIRQQHGLAYSASSYLSPGRYSFVLLGQFATRNDNAIKASKLARDVLQNFAKLGPAAEEVQNAIDYITGSFPLALDDLSSQVSYLTSIQRYNLGIDYLKKRNSYFRAVTKDDVANIARKLLAKPPLMILVGQPEEKTK